MLCLGAKIKKKKEKSQKSEKREKRRQKELSEKLVKDLTPLDIEKARFTEHKIRLSAHLKSEEDRNDPETVKLLEETRELYRNVVTLYEQVLAQWDTEITGLEASIAEIQSVLELAQYNLKEMRVLREQHNKVGGTIMEKLFAHDCVRPMHQEGKLRLSRDERKFLKEEALFYKELYEEATRDVEQEMVFNDAEKASIEEINTLTTNKERLSADLQGYRTERKRVKQRFSDLKYRNKQLNEPLLLGNNDILTIEEEEEEEMRVETQLMDGNYDALVREYDQAYHAYFLTPLIEMYQMNHVNEIARFSSILINLLVNPSSAKVVAFYEMLLTRDDLTNEDIPPRLSSLIPTIHSMSKIEAFTEIMRLITSDDDDEEEKAGENLFITDEFISEQTEKIETRKAELLFSPYNIGRREAIQSFSRYACVYIAQIGEEETVAINMVLHNDNSETQDTVYELLAEKEGFAVLKQLFRLEIFPHTIVEPCPLLRHHPYKPVHVYVTEFLPSTLERIVKDFDEHDKFCVLFELLVTLQYAKKQYGIQHNQLDLLNIRLKRVDDVPRSYKSPNGSIVECHSTYRVTLVDFSKASLNPRMEEGERQLLQGADYASFYRLVTLQEMSISDDLIGRLEVEDTTFDNLMMLLVELKIK